MVAVDRVKCVCVVAAVIALSAVAGAAERRWQLLLDGIFRDASKPLYIYARQRQGQWITGVGSSRDPDREGRKTYNRSWYWADLSTVPVVDGVMKGSFTLYVTPDLWVPRDHKPYTMQFEVDAKLDGPEKLAGSYQITEISSDDESVQDFGRQGRFSGTASDYEQPEMPKAVTLQFNMQASLVGGDPTFGDRCMVLWMGLERGKVVSGIYGGLNKKHQTFGRKGFSIEGCALHVDKDRVTGKVAVAGRTLDMEPCRYVYEIDGHVLEEVLVGTYHLTVEVEGGKDVKLDGSFDGRWYEGVSYLESDDRPWYKPVEGFKAPAAGEHPRLLFRKSDLPALRARANTAEGKAILKRLRYLLNGSDGETMTTVFSDADHAYMGGGMKNSVVDKPGVYTISHAAGYGLLYQLTGDEKYARFGKQCFEKALAGVRDRDDRYSFRTPGGALRAGPVLGWYAVGYDLCYDGWDQASREKFGRAIFEYEQGSGNKKIDLEALARGTMPPSSNHFGMQVGGASLALLALSGEQWIDQDKVDRLLAIAAEGMVRNVTEGFGDGGFFAEGDGTGSMASHIAYLSAIAAWRNAAGRDYVDVERPNVRMLSLKWLYQTVVRRGKCDFWPIRGSYGHNVWAREGLSGGGYFAIGFGAVGERDKAAMKWFYNSFLAEADSAAGKPCDTVSSYPHVAVSAFVNWPVDIVAPNPTDIMPLCYRDSSCGFYAWRNRWHDENDMVITVLTNRTEGYMTSKPDRALAINSMGRHLKWGTVKDGPAKYWRASPDGRASSLTLADGTCFLVDFSGASGADVMLVTTGSAEGETVELGGKKLTFYFPTIEKSPTVTVDGSRAVVGRQKISVVDGNLAAEVQR